MAELFSSDASWNPEITIDGWVHQTQRAQLGRHTTYSAGKLIVALDGACRDNGKAKAKAAVGVFFGHGNSHNRAEMQLDEPDIVWTSQRAELWAACRAVRLVTGLTMKACNHCSPALRLDLDAVIFKSDSTYVVRGITDVYMKWQRHEWKNAFGKPIANKDLWDRLYKQVTRLQRFGICVYFWHVRRMRNHEADHLANMALIHQLPPVYPYPKVQKRKRDDAHGATSGGQDLVDTSTISDPVWKHHHALAHLDLDIFKRTLRFYRNITDITEADILAKIESNERCQSCHERGARYRGIDDDEQSEEPAAKRARVAPPQVALIPTLNVPMVEPPAPGGLAFARDFQFSFEPPSNPVF